MSQAKPPLAPPDADARRAIPPVVCYDVHMLPPIDRAFYERARANLSKSDEIIIPARDARCIHVPAGHIFRIVSIDGPQVGDLNLWNANNLTERFYSGKTRALHRTHVSTGDRLWSTLPHLRPLATITHDTLAWYGFDQHGGGIHDVIGTRCDPYTNRLLKNQDYHHCCHSNLTRALYDYITHQPYDRPPNSNTAVIPDASRHAAQAQCCDAGPGPSKTPTVATRQNPQEIFTRHDAEMLVHDVLNVFMCTGFTTDTHQYFMKASPVRPGDYIEFFAEIDLIAGLSACPGGDCSTTHSSDTAQCFPLKIDIYKPDAASLAGWTSPQPQPYDHNHGLLARI